jgi:hypothetical protein
LDLLAPQQCCLGHCRQQCLQHADWPSQLLLLNPMLLLLLLPRVAVL